MSESWWIALVGMALTVCLAVSTGMVKWMSKVHALLASMTKSLEAVPVLFQKVDMHTERLAAHAERLAVHHERLANLEREDD